MKSEKGKEIKREENLGGGEGGEEKGEELCAQAFPRVDPLHFWSWSEVSEVSEVKWSEWIQKGPVIFMKLLYIIA